MCVMSALHVGLNDSGERVCDEERSDVGFEFIEAALRMVEAIP